MVFGNIEVQKIDIIVSVQTKHGVPSPFHPLLHSFPHFFFLFFKPNISLRFKFFFIIKKDKNKKENKLIYD